MQKRVEAINPDSDLQAFVNANRPENPQPPPRAQYMSWDGTLIEDLGPRKEAVQTKPLNNSGASNSAPQEVKSVARVDNTPKAVETKAAVVQTAPVQQVCDEWGVLYCLLFHLALFFILFFFLFFFLLFFFLFLSILSIFTLCFRFSYFSTCSCLTC
jgi:hypothetical protein